MSEHKPTFDHLPASNLVQRFNRRVAITVTKVVGTMWCAYVFTAISLTSLPSVIAQHSVAADISWLAQTFLQLVLLSIILVGQNVAAEASDARALRTLQDAEQILNELRKGNGDGA